MSRKFQDEIPDLSAEIKPLVHKLGAPGGEEGGGVVLTFISARSGEGTTTVARSFARAVHAETGRKVLLIEGAADENAMGNGIVELAAAGTDIASALSSIGPGISAGKWATSAEGKTRSGRVMQDKAFWQSLHDGFDIAVIDAPSLQDSQIGVAFAQVSNATVLVVEAESTRKEVVENLRDTLAAANAKVAGVVMNKRKFYIPEKVYKRL